MKKIITFLLLCTGWSYAQTCQQTFTVSGIDQENVALTVNLADLNCSAGTLNSITITSATLGSEFLCNQWYSFVLDIDGASSDVCAVDLVGVDVGVFSTLTITASDVETDNFPDNITLSVTITVDYTAETIPNCDAILTSPADGTNEAPANGVLTWSAASGGVAGYLLSVGTTSNGAEVLSSQDVGNVLTYDIAGILLENTTYFVNIIPYNSNGNAIGCTQYSFTTGATTAGDFCSNAIDLTALESPLEGTTFGALDDSSPFCGTNTSPDLFYSILVPAGSTLRINQTSNNYDSRNYIFYGDCENQNEINCFDDPDVQLTVWENTTGENQTVYWVQDGWQTNSGNFILEWSVIACTNAEVAYSVVPDCDNGEQFLVNVIVIALGSATSVTVSDDQGSNPQTLSDIGEVQFGPYPNATPVIFTLVNDQDSDCSLTSAAITQSTCPPSCDNATSIETCGDAVVAQIIAGNGSWSPGTCGFFTPGNELLYSFTPTITGVYSLQVTTSTGGYIDYFYKESSGSCDEIGWTCIADLAFAATVEIGELQEGVTYLILLDGEGTGAKSATFTIVCAPTCTNGSVSYNVVSDCTEGNEQFFVDVNINSMGSAVSMTVADDQGSESVVVTEISTVTFGPYPNTTPIIFTVSNDDDATCILTSNPITQSTCPPTCENAVVIENCGDSIDASILAGVGAWNPATCGFDTPGTELLYSFTPTITGVYSLQVTAATGGYIDYFYKEASGSCDATDWICIADLAFAATAEIGELQQGVTYLILLDGEGTTAKSATFNIECAPTCTDATSSYSLIADCSEGNEQFFVGVNITSMGSAVSLTVSDDQGSNTQSVTEIGSVQFGPYPLGTPVVFTVADDADVTCVYTSPTQTLLGCPPANDNCENATPMVITGDFDSSAIIFNNTGATVNPLNPLPSCGATNINTTGKDVWYQSTAPASGNVTVETRGNGGLTDTVITIYTGSCEDLIEAGCDDDAGLGNYSLRVFTGLTPGIPLFIRVWGWNGSQGTALLGCFDAALLNTNSVDIADFKHYPNPVKDVLNLSYSKDISTVVVFNLVGQQVLTKTINANQGQIDMSSLSAGAYLVKVAAENQVKTIKVVKQ